jgi:Acyl-CoA synthetases (AMP-forming)/AMP-acid ligases II
MLLTELLKENINKFGEYDLLYHHDKIYTNIDTEMISSKVSSLIRSLGIEKGDRVLICIPNCPEVIFSYQGVLGAGAIIVPVMYLLHENEINFILKNSEAKAVITSSTLLPKIINASTDLANKPKIICIDQPNTSELEQVDIEIIEWEKALANITAAIEKHPLDMEETDIAVILYTSGTTGVTKRSYVNP